MVAIGTIICAVLGFWVGYRGRFAALLLGLGGTACIAVVQFTVIHPQGIYGGITDWPWGAVSLVAYVAAAAAGVAAARGGTKR